MISPRCCLICCVWLLAFLCAFAPDTAAQLLRLPPRLANAPSGSVFAQSIANLSLEERESRIEAEILRGNVPEFLRRLKPITIRQATASGVMNSIELFVTPEYLCVGSDADYFLTPMMPRTAQRVADAAACSLPSARIVDAIYAAAEVRLPPQPIAPSAAMIRVPVFVQHNAMVGTQRGEQLATWPLGSLVAGHKKDVVLSNRLTNAPGKVAIYGWHQTNGKPIQPLYTGHADTWVDYSHGMRLVQAAVKVNGEERLLADLLQDPKFAALLSDEGALAASRYPTKSFPATNRMAVVRLPSDPAEVAWSTNDAFGERSATFQLLPDVRVQINEPLPSVRTPGSAPLMLVIYALPNGNTLEQTAGRRMNPGDDWHFDIQHIAAQTRFLRAAETNRVWVTANLEASQKSWPTWRKANAAFPSQSVEIVEALVRMQTNRPVRIALCGHSGGGSFIFGYLNAVERIPDRIERIAFLDANYAYDPAQGHTEKLASWLKATDRHYLSVLAYNDAVALLDGEPFVSATGGTWYRSHLLQTNLSAHFEFSRREVEGMATVTALSNRVQLLLKENPERKIFHTVQVERNGFIQAMLSGTPLEGHGYEYFGARAYERWIEPAPAR